MQIERIKINIPPGDGPFPAIIAIGGISIPIPDGIATIIYPNDQVAAQTTQRGRGNFFDLYGRDYNAGALIAWAWGISRVIDALETMPELKIDTRRIGVTGCSRNAKGAFVAGAFDSRITLTIPQESGSGGAACWRISEHEADMNPRVPRPQVEAMENFWFSKDFDTYGRNLSTLPYDHHFLPALIAPRGLYVVESNIDWLVPVSSTTCMKVGRGIYNALGVPDAMGFSLVGGHNHCQFPAKQEPELLAFIDQYLLNGTSSTADIERSEVEANVYSWVDWQFPVLSG